MCAVTMSVLRSVVFSMAILLFANQWSPPGAVAVASSKGSEDVNVRDKRIAESPGLMDSGARVRIKKAHQLHQLNHGNEQQLRALGEFLKQTRQLGVPDSEALALLDHELANARLPSLKASLGSALPSQPTTPVYHATPLRPFGALHFADTKPYEKQHPSATPIKEDQHDTPAPKRPLVVESSMPLSKPQPSVSPEHLVALQSPGKVTDAIPIKTKPHYVPVPAKTLVPVRQHKPSVQIFQPADAVSTYHSEPKLTPTPQPYPINHKLVPTAVPYPVIQTVVPVPTAAVSYPVKQNPVAPLHDSPKDEHDGYASRYQFGYRIRDPHSGSDFGHSEAREGEHTEGGYHVLLPDGRVQNVRYWAGPSGFHAKVSYTGDATHPHRHQ